MRTHGYRDSGEHEERLLMQANQDRLREIYVPEVPGDPNRKRKKPIVPPIIPPIIPPIFPPVWPPIFPVPPGEDDSEDGGGGGGGGGGGSDDTGNDEEFVYWTVEPGACAVCINNSLAGPVRLGNAFPSGDTAPPAHDHCRCNLQSAVGTRILP